jgi:PKD repeat protein
VTLLAAALSACAPDETPTAPGVVQQLPPLASPPTRNGGIGYATRGELRQGFVLDRAGKPMKVTYEIHHGVAIWQGDIELGRASDVATTPEAARPYVRNGGAAGGSNSPVNAQATLIIAPDHFRWPGGVVPYVIDAAVPSQTRIADAITMIESTTGGVTFVPRTGQADYVKFIASDGCSSSVGRQGGEQTLRLTSDCGTGATAHEMLHALGMEHEQSRCDRDDYVEILFDNVEDGQESNFEKKCDGTTDFGVNYDFGSMMHYALDAFSKNGQPTMRLRPGVTYSGPIGALSALSVLDRFAINFLYGLNNIRPVPRIGPLANSYDEGSEVPFDATGSTDADDKVLTYSWNFGDETCFALIQPADCTQAQPKHRYATDGGYKVGLFVSDSYYLEATETVVTIRNVAPSIFFDGSFGGVDEGSTWTVGGGFTDPGTDPWSATVDYGDGGGTQTLALSDKRFTLSHTYADDGVYDVNVSVRDDHETTSKGGPVGVRNVKPDVRAGADQTFTSGQTFNLAGSFSDPGVRDAPWAWSVAWGSGTPTAGSTNTQGAISASRRMCAAGTYTVTLSVTDKDGGTGSDDVQVSVGYLVVGLSIMPGSSPTTIAISKKGTVPVAILSTATFDATTIDVASIRLGDGAGAEAPVDQQKGRYQSRIDDANGDGRPDMIVSFSVPQLVANGDLPQGTPTLVLRGVQGATGDSCTNFRGTGTVRVVP